MTEVEYHGDGTVTIINKQPKISNPPKVLFYYFYGFRGDTHTKAVFVGTDFKELEQRKKDFESIHYDNKTTNIVTTNDIKIFELGSTITKEAVR